MHPQVGKAGNISALTPGIVSVTDTNNPVTGGSLTYRSAAQFNNSWNWNVHYRAAVSYITGSHNFKVGFQQRLRPSRGHHLQRSAAPYSYTFTAGPAEHHLPDRSAHGGGRIVDRDLGIFAQDRWNTGRWTL